MVPLLLIIPFISAVEGICRNLNIKEIRPNKRLANHTIETIQPIKDIGGCFSLCYLESHCFGLNFCVYQNSTNMCELTDSDHIRAEKELEDKTGCTFYGSESSCSSEPCQNNATCQGNFDYEPSPYKCICPAGYTGQACEKEINECISGPNDCHENATCSNTQGGFECTCQDGFNGNGKHCEVCNTSSPLGMESAEIPDDRITASSIWNRHHSGGRARLNMARVREQRGAWSAKENNEVQWLQVDMLFITVIKGIATQGRQDTNQWVTSYILQYCGPQYTQLIDYEGGKLLKGNYDRSTIIKHDLRPFIIARCIRVQPRKWHRHISMRIELYGCR